MIRLRKPSPAMVVACISLFIALGGVSTAAVVVLKKNSVLSKHIKNGQVKTPDLAANAINSSKIGDGSLLAQDFAAGQLPAGPQGPQGGQGPQGPRAFVDVLQGNAFTGTPPNDVRGCTQDDTWRECATVNVVVPANKVYRVAIDSAGSYFAFTTATRVQICPSVRPSTAVFDQATHCANTPTGITIPVGNAHNSSTNGVRTLSGGAAGTTYVVSTAIHTTEPLHFFNGFDRTVLHTLVTVADVT